MIIWLASYPKSGNTWVRLFLNSLVFTSDTSVNINDIKLGQFPARKYFNEITNNVDDVKEFIQNCNYAQSKLNLDNKIKFFKTHNGLWKLGQHRFTDNEKNPYTSKDLSILKYSLPEYIKKDSELMKLINEIKDAEVKDGGSGAFYIFLKK